MTRSKVPSGNGQVAARRRSRSPLPRSAAISPASLMAPCGRRDLLDLRGVVVERDDVRAAAHRLEGVTADRRTPGRGGARRAAARSGRSRRSASVPRDRRQPAGADPGRVLEQDPVVLDGAVGGQAPGETSAAPGARPAAPDARAQVGVVEQRAGSPWASASGSSGGTSRPVSPRCRPPRAARRRWWRRAARRRPSPRSPAARSPRRARARPRPRPRRRARRCARR